MLLFNWEVRAMYEIREMLRLNLKRQLDMNEKRFNKKQFAKLIGVSPAAVSQWLIGKNSPDIETIAKICDVLNIRFSDLITYPKEIRDMKKAQLIDNYNRLNDIGKSKLLEHSEDLIATGKYSIEEPKEKRA